MKEILGSIEANPVIAAVRQEEDIDLAVESQVSAVFLLHADIFNVKALVDKIKNSGKSAFIHIDLLEGLGKDHRAIDYISREIKPDGIITTKSTHIKYAKECGLFTIQRFFLVDSQSFDLTVKTARATQPDMLEIMPAVMPGIISRLCKELNLPIIAGGLITSKEEIFDILKSGAIGASTGKAELWEA
jgi:Glycerol-3-phosphate responsive antiterminator (mRNA-binding)